MLSEQLLTQEKGQRRFDIDCISNHHVWDAVLDDEYVCALRADHLTVSNHNLQRIEQRMSVTEKTTVQ